VTVCVQKTVEVDSRIRRQLENQTCQFIHFLQSVVALRMATSHSADSPSGGLAASRGSNLGKTLISEYSYPHDPPSPTIHPEATASHLEGVLLGNTSLALQLAHVIHTDISCAEELSRFSDKLAQAVPLQTLGIWIDPIDSTSEYIKGVNGDRFKVDSTIRPAISVGDGNDGTSKNHKNRQK
jgi:hypothetical protein